MLVRQAPACSGRPVDAQGYLLGNGPSLGNSACAHPGAVILLWVSFQLPGILFILSALPPVARPTSSCKLVPNYWRRPQPLHKFGDVGELCHNSKRHTPYRNLHKAPFSAEQQPRREERETIAEHKSCVARNLPRHPPRGTSAIIGRAQQPRPPGRTLALRFPTGNDSVGSCAAFKTRAAGYPRVS